MNKNRMLVLIAGIILVLACSVATGAQPPAQPTQAPLPTFTPYPTYTPYPTQVIEVAPTATQVPPTVEAPTQPAGIPSDVDLVKPDESYNGTTLNASQKWYFNGKEGQRVSIMVVGINHYQTFSIRDTENDGLIGCTIETQSNCAIRDYKLPYTGVYYILVDRTDSPQYYKYCWKRWQGSTQAPVWCYVGGPYSLQLTIQ